MPEELKDLYDQEKYENMTKYNNAKDKFNLGKKVFEFINNMAFLAFGVYGLVTDNLVVP